MGLPARALLTLLPAATCAAALLALGAGRLPIEGALPWVPSLGVDLAWRVDGLSALMLLMIAGVGTAVFVYAGGYMRGERGIGRLYVLLTLFFVAMVGCVVADDLIALFVAWEATSVVSFLLVGFHHEDGKARKAAQQALLVTGLGGLCLLTGSLLLGQVAGTTRISALVAALPSLPSSPALVAGGVLVVVGCLTKSAQVPFHFWLPNAMSAPTPVSAYLHSATMVKLGVYVLARLDPALGHWPLWETGLKAVGAVTAAWGMVLALRERDLKRILAWSTVATLGTLTMLVGVRGPGAPVAVGALLLAHALYKAPLFFVAGNVDHGAGTRIIDRLGGLRRAMPWTAAAALLAGVSMAGVPLSFGYVAKDFVLDLKRDDLLGTFAQVGNAFFSAVAVAVAGVAAVRVFWRHPGVNETPDAHEGGASLVLPPLLLAVAGVALGVLPSLAEDLLAHAAAAMTGEGVEAVALSLDLLPALSSLALTLGVGVAVFLGWDRLHGALDRAAARIGRVGMPYLYERLLSGIPRATAAVTRRLQHGHLPRYVATLSVVAALALLAAWAVAWPALRAPSGLPASLGALGAGGLIAVGALLACGVRDRLVLLLSSGLVGYGSAALFLFVGAPDLAFTQFAVETVFVVIAAAVLLRLRRAGRALGRDERRLRPAAALRSLAFGAGVTGLVLVAAGATPDPALADFFSQQSVPAAHGRNVVNVVLVDFRGFDTLGEIVVVLLSLLAALPLLRHLAARRAPGGGLR